MNQQFYSNTTLVTEFLRTPHNNVVATSYLVVALSRLAHATPFHSAEDQNVSTFCDAREHAFQSVTFTETTPTIY